MKRLFLLSMCLLSLSTTFAQETDSMKTQHINEEVVVTAQNHVAIKDGVSYIPTPEERKSSSNYAALLARMMVAGLRVDEFSNKVETNWGKEVHFFINGVEANGWELKTLRPKEVARVDFLQSPSEPKYKNSQWACHLEWPVKLQAFYLYTGKYHPECHQSLLL